MTAAAPTTTGAARAPRSTLAWIGLFAAPLAWAVHIGARYPLVRFACDAKQTWALHAVSLGCALAAGAGLACAIVAARRARPAEPGLESDADVLGPSPPAARRVGLISVLARAGVVTSLVFLGSIVAEAVPVFVHDPCARSLTS